jgi:hypothetical protein
MRWNVRDENARMLPGGMSNDPLYELKKIPDRVLDTDRLTRISYFTGIFKALNSTGILILAPRPPDTFSNTFSNSFSVSSRFPFLALTKSFRACRCVPYGSHLIVLLFRSIFTR